MMAYGRRSSPEKITFGIILCMPLVLASVAHIIVGIGFNQDVSGHLKRAADANSVEMARNELSAALEGMKDRGCTSGRSHVLWYTPSCDVGFWHDNIESAKLELDSFPTDAEPLVVSNQLMKLRETLLDDGSGGVSVTLPPNIVVYPNQTGWLAGWIFSVLGAIVGVILFCVGLGID
jgi:hypothetical protein